MKKDDVMKYCKKKVKIFLKNSFVYNGSISYVNNDSIEIIDKFGAVVTIGLDEITVIKTNGNRK